jgi:PAS domain S-box-containing protein
MANRRGKGFQLVGDPGHRTRNAAIDGPRASDRASDADQALADADQTVAHADQIVSGLDQSGSDSDQAASEIDQRASDRDQASADRQQAASIGLTVAETNEYETSRLERKADSATRERNRFRRGRTSRERDDAADERDRIGGARDDDSHERDVRAADDRSSGREDAVSLANGEMTEAAGAKYRGLLEAAPDAMVVVNPEGEIVLLNLQAEKQFGYHRDELVGQQVTNIIPEGFAERLIADDLRSAADALAQQIGTGIELIGRRKDGTEFPIEIMLSPLESAEGILVTAAIRNISARKMAENQLLQAQKLESVGRLAGGIAHDFNNMLFAILGYAELLAQDLVSTNRAQLDPDRALHSVEAITQAAERASALTAQLLAFSRQQIISPTVLDLNRAIGGLEPMVRQLIGSNMHLVLRLDRNAGRICADSGQLDQIVVNLVVNARDAMPDGGNVTIETRNVWVDEPNATEHFDVRPGPYVLLVVQDSGTGMDRATREHIFEPFFTTKELGKGTGLGLATTYGIVRQAGGHIWVYSEPGFGTSFKLYFPRIDETVTPEGPAVVPAPAIGAGRVLVVEDEPIVRDITTQLLTRSGFEVIAIPNGAEAMRRLAEHDASIDVLVTDVILPNMSGIELAEWTMDRHPQVGIVLLSGYMAETLNLEHITTRGATFVPKPITSSQLIIAVQRAQALRRANPTVRTGTSMSSER